MKLVFAGLLISLVGGEHGNMVFIKVPKCASSTSGGVARRIAHYWNLSHVFDGDDYTRDDYTRSPAEPKIFANHIPYHSLEAHIDFQSLRLPNFPTWTMIRDPSDRWLSEYFHFVVKRSNGKIVPTEDSILQYLNDTRHRHSNYILEYIRPSRCSLDVDCTIQSYDFIGVVELYDISMIQLAKVVGVPLPAVLYLPSKVSAHRKNAAEVNEGAAGQADSVRNFLQSPAWLQRNALDLDLWNKVAAQLKANMDDAFNAQLNNQYLPMLQQASLLCGGNDRYQDCYWADNGCGFHCLDRNFYTSSDNNVTLVV